ncbi:hypothetical protein PanWU01x14_234150, partial [Parasponia andersonii]
LCLFLLGRGGGGKKIKRREKIKKKAAASPKGQNSTNQRPKPFPPNQTPAKSGLCNLSLNLCSWQNTRILTKTGIREFLGLDSIYIQSSIEVEQNYRSICQKPK